MRYFEDFSYEEIAGCLDVPLGTVKARIHRAREMLKSRLAGKDFWWNTGGSGGRGPSVTIWEEDGKKFKKIVDFDEAGREKLLAPAYNAKWADAYAQWPAEAAEAHAILVEGLPYRP